MRLPAVALLALLVSGAAAGHPSRGIAVAPDGRVYFSDLQRIWSVSPQGRLTLLRGPRGVHTHALSMTRGGDLVGEDSEYDPTDQRYRETVWRISRSGRFSYLYGPTKALERGVGVIRDTRGCTYHSDEARPGAGPLVHRRCRGRAERLVGSAADDRVFRPALVNDIAGTALGSDGSFYFRQGTAVRKLSPSGRVSVVADGLAAENFGIAINPVGGVYIAEFGRRRVLRVAPNGRRRVVAMSAAPWGLTGVAFRSGSLFVLEATEHRAGVTPRVRVRSIAPAGARTLAQVSIPGG